MGKGGEERLARITLRRTSPPPPGSPRLDCGAVFETLVVLLIAAAIVTLIIKRRGRSGVAGLSKRSAYIRLLKQAGGDDELADRLVEAERARNPYATNNRLAELALARWMKDRRN